jgi:hypothetical protein
MKWDSGKLTAATVLVENTMRNRVGRESLTTLYCNAHIYFYTKTTQMHKVSNLFYFGTTHYIVVK